MSSDDTRKEPPSPEEFQKQLQDFMKQMFPSGSYINFSSSGKPIGTPPASDPEPEPESAPAWQFDYKPRDVKKYLDRYVIKQDEAKKVLSVALCDHYHQVRLAREKRAPAGYAKQNILLIGPTGVGKTYLIRSIAELINVPFVKADATKFSETGYVGADAEDLVRDLVRQADGEVERAEFGIIYIDEIDKIAGATTHAGRDVSGRGVQTNLLKLMEETEVPVRAPHDISGQIQSMMEFSQSRRTRKRKSTINTGRILFVVSGAFDGLEKIVRKRLKDASIGFAAPEPTEESGENLLAQASTPDFIEMGFEPEFIGRLPVRVVCRSLSRDDLFEILKSSEGSIIRQYEQSFAAYGIEADFQESGLRRIAELAAEEKTGARGLMTVCERVFRDFKFELPSTSVRRLAVDRDLVDQSRACLEKLIAEAPECEVSAEEEGEKHAEPAGREPSERSQPLEEFIRQFQADYGLELRFTPAAVERVLSRARAEAVGVEAWCRAKFKDFQFGLNLIRKNTGQTCFTLNAEDVDAPDRALSNWVVSSYRQSHSN